MDTFGLVAFLPVLIMTFASKMKTRTRNICFLGCLWINAGFLAFSNWRLYEAWRVASAVNAPENRPQFPNALIWGPVLTVFIMALPVVWYYRDLHKERLAGKPA